MVVVFAAVFAAAVVIVWRDLQWYSSLTRCAVKSSADWLICSQILARC